VLTAGADTVHDPLFGDAQWSGNTASEDPRILPRRRFNSASAGVDRHISAKEDAGAADSSAMQAWTLSSLEAAPLDASPAAAMGGDETSDTTAAIWRRLGSTGRSAGHSGARFPSGFVVDDLQSSGAGLPLRASLAAAASAASGGSVAVEAVHDLHDPKGRGTGVPNALSALHLAIVPLCRAVVAVLMIYVLCKCHLPPSMQLSAATGPGQGGALTTCPVAMQGKVQLPPAADGLRAFWSAATRLATPQHYSASTSRFGPSLCVLK